MKFDVAVTMLQGVTSSRRELQAALQAADLARRNPDEAEPPREHILVGTKLHEAVPNAARDVMAPEQGRKALILLTDGVDFGSRIRLDRAIEHAQRADTLVYSILYFDPRGYARQHRQGNGMPQAVSRKGQPTLKQLSAETGGLRNQSSMGFTPDHPESGGYRKIRLTARNPGLTVQARDGYYAR